MTAHLLSGFAGALLFLKATVKKQIYIPSFTKQDGTTVAGHYKFVHVADDHDEHKILAGQGSHSQKIAHAKLSKEDWFNALPHDHKVAVLLAHATDHQNTDSANARASTLTKNILNGKKPTASEWKAWGYIDDAKRQKLYDQITEAGKGEFFQSCMDASAVKQGMEEKKTHLDHMPAAAAAEPPKAEEKPASAQAEISDAVQSGDAGKMQEAGLPKEAAEAIAAQKNQPQSAPQNIPETIPAPKLGEGDAFIEKLKAQKLDASNVNAPSFNAKVDAIKAAFAKGDAKALLAMSYGTNTYGKKAAKLANEALALLKHEHQVAPGQKANSHPALNGLAAGDKAPASAPNPAPKVVAAAPIGKPADPAIPAPPKISDFTSDQLVKVWHGIAQDGDTAKLADSVGKFAQTMQDKAWMQQDQDYVAVANYGKQLLEALGAPAAGKPVDADFNEVKDAPESHTDAKPHLIMPAFEEGKEKVGVKAYYEKVGQKIIDMAMAGDVAGLDKLKEDGLKPNSKGKVGNTWKGKTANSKLVLALHAAALQQAKDWQSNNTFSMPDASVSDSAPAADSGPKEGDTKPAADGGTLVLKDGHWIKQEQPSAADGFPPKPTIDPVLQSLVDDAEAAAKKGDTATLQDIEAYVGSQLPEGDAKQVKPYLDALHSHLTAPAAPNAAAKLTVNELEEMGSNFHAWNIQDAALKGDIAKVQAEIEGAQADGYAKTVSGGKKILAKMQAKIAAPAAAAQKPVGLSDEQIPAKPSGASSMYYDKAKELAKEGDLAGLKELHQMLVYDGYSATYPVVGQMIAAMENTAAPAGSKGLDASEFPPVPNSAAPDEVAKINQLAMAGEASALKQLYEGYDNFFPATKKYAGQVLSKLTSKQEAGAPASVQPPEGAPIAPQMHSPSALKNEIIGKIQQALVDGDMGAINTQLTLLGDGDASSADFAALKVYAHIAKDYLQDKVAPASSMPAKPANPYPDTSSLSALKKQALQEIDAAMAANSIDQINKVMQDIGTKVNLYGKSPTSKWHVINEYAGKAKDYILGQVHGVAAQPAPVSAAAADTGPKDGDTKPGANGMLVFKDGRWHKMGTDPKELKKKALSVPIPSMSGTYSIKMKKTMKALQQVAMEQGAEGLDKYVKVLPSGNVKINKIGDATGWGAMSENHSVDNAAKMIKYTKALLEAMAGTSGQASPKVVGAQAAAQPAAPSSGPVKPAKVLGKVQTEKVGDLVAIVADDWKQTGPQKGSNPGGRFVDGKGQEWYCKFPNDPDTVKNELLAAKFYEMLGANVPHLRLVKKDGQLGIASKWVDGIAKHSAADLAKAPGTHGGFVFDAWLANWDVVGLSNDNLMLDKDGKALRVDVGGSLVYRAQGGKKGDAFGNEVAELKTLVDAGKNSQSAAVFKGISKADLAAGGKQLAKLKPSQIDELVMKAGPGSDADKQALAEKLKARRKFILNTLGLTDQWDKPPVDETKVRVKPEDIPAGIDFFHHPEKNGGPMSSKEHVNKQNTIDSQALADFAKKGDLKALKDYHYDAYNKESGEFIGKKPITEHPSNHIQKQWASLVQTLQSIAYPPAETLDMPSFGYAGTLDDIAKEVGAFAPHENVTTVPAEHRMGYFMKLAQIDSEIIQDYVNEKKWMFQKVGNAFDQAGKEHYKKCSQTVKSYISGVQSSGSINHIWSQGKSQGNGMEINQFTKKIYDEAQSIPEGTQLWRWMDDDTAGDIMTKQLISAAPGTVIQNTDSMCTSFRESWGATDNPHFCSEPKKAILMRIRCADGSMATPSHGSGGYQSESEVTTLPGARFVVVSVTKGDHRHPDGILVDCIMLPPDEGFVAQLSKTSPLAKSLAWSQECQTNKSMKSNAIVFLRKRSASRVSTI